MNSRRRFLHLVGTSVVALGAGALVGCRGSSAGQCTTDAECPALSTCDALTRTCAGGTRATVGVTTTSSTQAATTGGGAGGAGGHAGAGGAGGHGGAGGSKNSCTKGPTGMAVSPPAAFPSDGLFPVMTGPSVLIGRDAKGFYCLSSLCTHQGCDLNQQGSFDASGVQCLCHGTTYDLHGSVTAGPAISPLPSYQLELGCDGQLYADESVTVSQAQRLKA